MPFSSEVKAFEFVKINDFSSKPRKTGKVEIRGPYYNSLSLGHLKDLLDTWGEYVDGVKFAGGSQRLLPSSTVKKFIDTCHDYGCYVSTGGFVERVIVQGSKAVDKYLEECKFLEFDVIEVSSGLAPIPLEDKIQIVKSILKLGMEPKPEISMMIGAGAGTHIAGYKSKMRTVADFIKESRLQLKAGAKILMFESEGVTEDLPPKKWKTNIIKKVINEFGLKRWMFEAADPVVFKWYLKNYGQDVNVFIDYSQIVEYAAWKTKLWGDPTIWKGKKLIYKPQK